MVEIAKLRARANKARKFPANTCPASRHVIAIADALVSKRRKASIEEIWDAEHMAESLYSVVGSLWIARNSVSKDQSNVR